MRNCITVFLYAAGFLAFFTGCETDEQTQEPVATPVATSDVPESTSTTSSDKVLTHRELTAQIKASPPAPEPEPAKEEAPEPEPVADAEPAEPVEAPESFSQVVENANDSSNGISETQISVSPSIPDDATILTIDDNGGSATVQSNTVVVVQLVGNPTTGYTWSIDSYDASVLTLESHGYEPSSNDRVGSGGTFTFQFKTLTPGSTTLKLNYSRPWEKDVPPAKKFSNDLIVK